MARQTRKKAAPAGAAKVEEAKAPVETVEAVEAVEAAETVEAVEPVETVEAAEPVEAVETADAAALAATAPVEDVVTTEAPAQAGAFPGQYRLTNNTRMALSLPIVDAQVAASSSTDVAIRDEAQMKALRIELDTLAELNRFGKDAFVIAPQDAQ